MNIQSSSSHRYAKFGRGSVQLDARGDQPLELDTIAKACPSVLATEAHHSRTERYTYVSTMDVMKALAGEGFHPHSIMQGGSKDEEKRGFTKHLIRFRSQNTTARLSHMGSVYEVVMLGSHDGTTSHQMYGGFFRFACKNGTIFFDGEATAIKIPHKGDIIPKVIDATYTVVGQGQLAAAHVDTFRSINITRDESMAFATAAAQLRFDDESPVPAERLLEARRYEDRGQDLWSTFNRVQENVLRGGIPYTGQRTLADGRVKNVNAHTREVRSVDGDVRLNRSLWTLAEEMAKIKQA